MKKNTIKAFTLVEMLIVIVIIGILIAALMPRMQAAQGRARDVSRKTALSQIQSAIVVSQGDKGEWPNQASGANGIAVSEIKDELLAAGMNSIPIDPLKNKDWAGLGSFSGSDAGDYGYLVTKRNGAQNGGFVLMAKTEVEGGSNRVVCSGATTLASGLITSSVDIKNIKLCQTVTSTEGATSASGCMANAEKCYYDTDDELRYIVVY